MSDFEASVYKKGFADGIAHAASRQSRSKALLAEAIAILHECEQKWGCECPYCDRDFGNDFESHADDCRLKRFLDTANYVNRQNPGSA